MIDISTGLDGVTIIGAGMGVSIFQQSGSGDHFLEIKGDVTNVEISDLTIKNYDEADNGGAMDITTSGYVLLQDIHFDNNSTTTYYNDGGAVYISSSSTVTFDRCKFTNNSSYNSSASEGSCIYSEGTVTIQNCLFYDNTCNNSSADGTSSGANGHVYIDEGMATIVNCTFTDNNAGSPLYLYDDSGTPTVIKNCLFIITLQQMILQRFILHLLIQRFHILIMRLERVVLILDLKLVI